MSRLGSGAVVRRGGPNSQSATGSLQFFEQLCENFFQEERLPQSRREPNLTETA